VEKPRACAWFFGAWGFVGFVKLWGQPQNTALGYLLHPGQSASELDANFPRAFDSGADINRDLDKLAKANGGSIEVIPLPQQDNELKLGLRVTRESLNAATFKRKPAADWQIASFTGLTRDIHQIAHGGSSGSSGDSILDFPAGSHVGLLLHSLLEHLDFQGDIRSQCADLLPLYAPRFGLDSTDYQNILTHWMETLMISPLNHSGLTLSALSTQQRLNELAFDFALDSFSIDTLNHLLANISGTALTPINVESFRGMITGVIDLVFEYQGKYYLADYKSNYLGASLEDYTQQNLERAILDRRYDLQYLLYSIALHRYLSRRIPDYQYERDFGGVYYLFIRAMRPNQKTPHGVYFDLPDFADLNALDTLLTARSNDS
jgi:exodeoxyribonuclease V beta subunit